jgi:hypothetical protein
MTSKSNPKFIPKGENALKPFIVIAEFTFVITPLAAALRVDHPWAWLGFPLSAVALCFILSMEFLHATETAMPLHPTVKLCS